MKPTIHSMIAVALLTWVMPARAAGPFPWQRTETRATCIDSSLFRNPYFGDTHVHTTYSFDAVSGDVRSGPRDAYAFAKGSPIGLPPYDAQNHPLRTLQLGRPLDFTMVTDHSEFFGEEQICLTPGLPGYDSTDCQTYRGAIPELTSVSGPGIRLFGITYLFATNPSRFAFCGPGGADCRAQASLVWQDIQAAAEQHYDRTDACSFTTFVGYEWTANTDAQNLHRNVIFRNAVVPALPISYVDQPTPQGLWAQLKAQCLDGPVGCDVLAIPHNPNLSNGAMFRAENVDGSALSADDAAFRSAMEPLVEITQHKGDSECKMGVLSNDEQCSFEKWPSSQLGLPPTPDQVFPPLLFIRNALKEGLKEEERIGVNPFRLGLVGSTDTHNATPGASREDDYQGHLGTRDATPELMLAPDNAQGVIGGAGSNPGGLAVVWAEENSRDAIFAAMRRREVYATSGTRPIVRFFGGTLASTACGTTDFVASGYEGGIPMGGELGPVRGVRSPQFAVLAVKDPGEPGAPGVQLQRIQIVKGWIDGNGEAQEKVFEVAGNPNNGATVDTATCKPLGTGQDTLCAQWEDPEFNRGQRAFYYARVLENPVCRWSTRLCNAQGVDCAAGPPPVGLEACCDGSLPKTIQERAWTSPIWYRPEGIGQVIGTLRAATTPGADDRLTLEVGLGRTLDPDTQDLTVVVRDDHEIFRASVPAGTMRRLVSLEPPLLPRLFGVSNQDNFRHVVIPVRKRVNAGAVQAWLLRDTAGLSQLEVRVTGNRQASLTLDTRKADLPQAAQVDHFVEVEVSAGSYRASFSRLWRWRNGRLATS